MAASDISPDQFAKLCKRCACLKLRSTTPAIISPRDPSVGERSPEQEVDLKWRVTDVTDFLTRIVSKGGDKCDCCEFIHHIISWWQFYVTSVNIFLAGHVLVSLHYVFRLDETDEYSLKALRIRIRPDNQEFHIDCPITAATDHDMGTSLRLQRPLSHINDEILSWMKSKLESCVLHDHINPDKTFIPDRLIDVRGNQLSLVLTKDFHPRDAGIQRYIALTYCWGPEPHASKQLKTTSGNISQLQQQIAELSLPQVIKDAVAVARALSIPFLWVDALCILQDDGSDWDKQCAVMERIYGNAYATVAAASSSNCEEGFVKRTDRILLPFETHSGNAHVFGIYSPLYTSGASEDIIISPWLERGWTLQERMASTRLLIFSKRNVHFKCKYFSESMGGERDHYDADFPMLDRVIIESGGMADIYREWNDVISLVNPRNHQFTRETDLLPSIAGIAALFNSKLNDDYAAGLWKNNMHQSLCWTTSTEETSSYQDLLKRLKIPSPYIAPSWSWASQLKWFRFELYNPGLSDDCRPEFHSLNTAITLRGESAFGEVRHAALDISSKLYVGSPRITYHAVFRRFLDTQDTVRSDGRYFAHIILDCSIKDIFEPHDTRILAAPIDFLLIGSTIRRYINESSSPCSKSAENGGNLDTEIMSRRVAYGLLIHPTGDLNEYYRVGTFFSRPYDTGGLSIFNGVEVRTVRLV